uniref:Uncharacterized protein n=1 Tax=Romanomermis culicivorax TaxID=13658 RepID=A0A915J7S0_ROMCU
MIFIGASPPNVIYFILLLLLFFGVARRIPNTICISFINMYIIFKVIAGAKTGGTCRYQIPWYRCLGHP